MFIWFESCDRDITLSFDIFVNKKIFKMKNILIIIGVLLLFLVGGFFIFPFIIMAIKALIGLFFLILIIIGFILAYYLIIKK